MAKQQPSVKDNEKLKADIAAKERAKAANAGKKAEHAAEIDKPMSEEEAASIASLAGKGLQDGGSLTDAEVERLAGATLGKLDETGDGTGTNTQPETNGEPGVDTPTETQDGQDDADKDTVVVDKEAFEGLVARVGAQDTALEALGLRILKIEQAMRAVGAGVRDRTSHVGSIDNLGQIDNLKA